MVPNISPGGAKALRAMIVTCGSSGCFEAVRRLDAVDKPTSLVSLGQDKDGNWLMAAFQRLQWYAADRGLKTIEVADIVRYFGGSLHIEIMERIADHAGLGGYLGRDVGLVTHILLPLQENAYSNEGYIVRFRDPLNLSFGPLQRGLLFYHLGAVVRLDVSKRVAEEILAEQADSEAFMGALSRLDGQTIVPPKEYLEALNCTITKAKGLR